MDINKLGLRSLLWDKASGRLIKAVNERDLCDYLENFLSSRAAPVAVLDFAPAIAEFHKVLEQHFDKRDLKDLMAAKNAVFNTWVRFRAATAESVKTNLGVALGFEAEKVLSKIHFDLGPRYDAFVRATGNLAPFKPAKDEAFNDLMCYVDSFIEMLLCAVHATATIDLPSLKGDTVLAAHCNELESKLIEYLKYECGYYDNRFSQTSLIYQCCMEELGIDVEPLLVMMGVAVTKKELCQHIKSRASSILEPRGSLQIRKLTYEWFESDAKQIDRVRKLTLALQRIIAIKELMRQLQEGDFQPSASSDSLLEKQTDLLIGDNERGPFPRPT